jgi:sugar lactone lactonase YvrE
MGPDGFLYVGDHNNFRIRKVSLTGNVTTLAGVIWNTGPEGGQIDGDASVATFDAPYGVTVDRKGNVYVADLYNNKVRKVTPTGVVTTHAGGDYYHYGRKDGPAATALFYSPFHIAADPSGNIYVTEGQGSNFIRKISHDGIVTTVLGPVWPEGSHDLFRGGTLATDKIGNLFISIPEGILKRTPDGTIIRYAVGGIGETDGPAQVATYGFINGIAVDEMNNLYITDNNRIRKIEWR